MARGDEVVRRLLERHGETYADDVRQVERLLQEFPTTWPDAGRRGWTA